MLSLLAESWTWYAVATLVVISRLYVPKSWLSAEEGLIVFQQRLAMDTIGILEKFSKIPG
jgi:hypothetical protein